MEHDIYEIKIYLPPTELCFFTKDNIYFDVRSYSINVVDDGSWFCNAFKIFKNELPYRNIKFIYLVSQLASVATVTH